MSVAHTKHGRIKNARDNCKLSFSVISDMHINKESDRRQRLLEIGLKDMADSADRLNAAFINGDATDDGSIASWDRLTQAMLKYDIADETVLVVGNHDLWGPKENDYETAKKTYLQYSKKITGKAYDEPYFSTAINGYPIIVLGSEGCAIDAVVSEKQIEWFGNEMEKAAKTGKPIFVFFHHSINGSHGLPYIWELKKSDGITVGGIGKASDDIFAVIKQHKNVFYISGHIHLGFSRGLVKKIYSIEKCDGCTLINLPSFTYSDFIRGGHIPHGTGYVFEVYENKILIRARSFLTGTWCKKHDAVIPIV